MLMTIAAAGAATVGFSVVVHAGGAGCGRWWVVMRATVQVTSLLRRMDQARSTFVVLQNHGRFNLRVIVGPFAVGINRVPLPPIPTKNKDYGRPVTASHKEDMTQRTQKFSPSSALISVLSKTMHLYP